MGFYVSPSVNVVERDLSVYVAGVASSIAAYVGQTNKGPVWQRTLVTSERGLVDLFGSPTDSNYEDFYSATGYLSYGNTLYFTRVVNKASALNAELVAKTNLVSGGAGDYVEFHDGSTILNGSGLDYTPSFGPTEKILFFAKYPGAYGNTDLKVGLINYTSWLSISGSTTLSGYANNISDPPSSADEFVTLVSTVQPDGTYSLAEIMKVSTTAGKKDSFGNNIYVDDYINSKSSYILAFNNSSLSTAPSSFAETALTNGANGTTTNGDIATAYDLYSNPEDVDVNILIGGSSASQAIATAQKLITICEARKDCIAILDFPKTDLVNVGEISTAINNVLQYRQSELNPNTSYAALYANWAQIYDNYNDKIRWIPLSGIIAGIYANTDNVSDPWFAPAGLNRGILKTVLKLAINPDAGYRDILYKNGINPIVSMKGQGITVWGQKTLQSKPSAFDRVNVRRLFMVLEKAISTSSKYFVFEQNDDFTRAQFKNMVEPFLKDIKGRRGIYDYAVDVSERVNTPERVDRGEFWAEIYIKPTKVAEFLVLRFNATRTGVSFDEFLK